MTPPPSDAETAFQEEKSDYGGGQKCPQGRKVIKKIVQTY
jgi:hypothetical protein